MNKNKKATINPINDGNKFFQYVAIVVLNHEEIGRNSQRLSRIRSFISKYNWKEINYPSKKMTGKSLRKYPLIALNKLYVKK